MAVSGTTFPALRVWKWLAFYAAILLAWFGVFEMARNGAAWLCGPDTIRLLPMGGFWALFPMWAIMMAAMMLPTIIPTLRTYGDIPQKSDPAAKGWWGVIMGYCAIWVLGSAGFAGLQVLAINSRLVDGAGVAASWWLAAVLFLLAGGWQFTRTKAACQSACMTPMQYFMANWKPGFVGGWRMGVDIGIVCVGCCWAIMSLAFVGGVMSLLWMGLATVFMVAEKLPEIGMYLRRPAGTVLIGAGLYSVLQAIT